MRLQYGKKYNFNRSINDLIRFERWHWMRYINMMKNCDRCMSVLTQRMIFDLQILNKTLLILQHSK